MSDSRIKQESQSWAGAASAGLGGAAAGPDVTVISTSQMLKTTCCVGRSVLRLCLRSFCSPVDGALCHCSSCCFTILFVKKQTEIILWAWSSSRPCHEVMEMMRVWETNFMLRVPLMIYRVPHPHWFSCFLLLFLSLDIYFSFSFLVGAAGSKRRKRRESEFLWMQGNAGKVLCRLCSHI